MTTRAKRTHKDGVHPTEAAAHRPARAAGVGGDGGEARAHLGVTEGEAQAILGAKPATAEELAFANKVDLAAIAHALDADTAHALVTDPKLELGAHADGFEERAARLRVASSAGDKLLHASDDLHGAMRLDASVAQDALSSVVPVIRARARLNPKVRETYSSLLAYQHARYPGHRPGAHAAAPAPPPPPAPPPAVPVAE